MLILAFGHPPQTRLTVTDDMTPRLQRVLDAFTIPAIIRTASWDVIAWNAPAARVLTDYSQLPLAERVAAPPVYPAGRPAALWRTGRGGAAYRQRLPRRRHADGRHEETDPVDRGSSASRASSSPVSVKAMTSPATARAITRINHPQMGPLDPEFTSFAVEGRPDLSLLVFNPATTESQRKIHGLLQGRDPRRRRAEGKFIQHSAHALQRVDPQPAQPIEPGFIHAEQPDGPDASATDNPRRQAAAAAKGVHQREQRAVVLIEQVLFDAPAATPGPAAARCRAGCSAG